jgi:TIR domain
MPYDFFFSYTRANNDGNLRRFFEELNEEVRSKAGYSKGTLTGYFDQKGLTLGTEWSPALVAALQECATLVCLYSPAYFMSESCGREWGFFDSRRRLYLEQLREAGISAGELPAVIKPVIWIPIQDELPAGIDRQQFAEGDPHAMQNTNGLRYMRKRYEKFKLQYLDFIDRLATEILAARAKYPAGLPKLTGSLDFESVRNAFKQPLTPASGAVPRRLAQGPNAVTFVFVAGKPDEFPLGARATDSYRLRGGRDWKPYYPHKPKPIGALAQSVAAGEDLDFFSEELPFSVTLPGDVRKAEEQANIVVLLTPA